MKPSLQDIANMPREAGLAAIRKHYDPTWGEPLPEDHGELREFNVTISYRTVGQEYYTVMATSSADAEAKAEAKFDADYSDADIDDVIAEPSRDSQQARAA